MGRIRRFGLVGLLCLILGVSELRDNLDWRERALRTQATVVKLVDAIHYNETRSIGSADALNSETVEMTVIFEVGDERVELLESSSVLRWFYAEGDGVDVLYQAEEPASGRVDFFLTFWGLTGGVLVLGLMFAGGALLIFRMLGP